METPAEERGGYDDELEQEAYEHAQEAEDADAGPASEPDEPRPPQDE